MNRFISLMYHNLGSGQENRYTVSEATFGQQISWLVDTGYVVEGFPELARRLVCQEIPSRYVVLSFDDGHRSNLHAAEILRSTGAQATFFLTHDYCRQRADFLRDDEIKALANLCSVGSHGLSHAPLSRLGTPQLRSELAESRAWLEDLIGKPVTTFSAPGGFISPAVLRLAWSLGYTMAGNSVEWWNEAAVVARTRLVNRVTIRQGMALQSFIRAVEGAPSYLIGRRMRASVLGLVKRVVPLQQYERLSQSFYQAAAALTQQGKGDP